MSVSGFIRPLHTLFTVAGLLIVFSATMAIPSTYLAVIQEYRPLQTAPIGLLVALPQLITLPIVAALCNQRWVDCRWVMAIGIGLCALSNWEAASITSDWTRENYYELMALQIIGQPMAVVALLMSGTSVVEPQEGPTASALFNTIKAFSAVLASSIIATLASERGHFHFSVLVDQLGNSPHSLDLRNTSSWLYQITQQALVLTSADIERIMVLVAIALIIIIPFASRRVYPPTPCQPALDTTSSGKKDMFHEKKFRPN